MPGQGQLVYIAGHRTTYLAPFSRIDYVPTAKGARAA
jgi:sortase (surface protein transpeptidase)